MLNKLFHSMLAGLTLMVTLGLCLMLMLSPKHSHANDNAPLPLATFNQDLRLYVPAIRLENGDLYRATLQCDASVKICLIVSAQPICMNRGWSQFSPLNPYCEVYQ